MDQSGQLELSTVTTEPGAYETSFWLLAQLSAISFWLTSYQIRSSAVDQSGQLELSTQGPQAQDLVHMKLAFGLPASYCGPKWPT